MRSWSQCLLASLFVYLPTVVHCTSLPPGDSVSRSREHESEKSGPEDSVSESEEDESEKLGREILRFHSQYQRLVRFKPEADRADMLVDDWLGLQHNWYKALACGNSSFAQALPDGRVFSLEVPPKAGKPYTELQVARFHGASMPQRIIGEYYPPALEISGLFTLPSTNADDPQAPPILFPAITHLPLPAGRYETSLSKAFTFLRSVTDAKWTSVSAYDSTNWRIGSSLILRHDPFVLQPGRYYAFAVESGVLLDEKIPHRSGLIFISMSKNYYSTKFAGDESQIFYNSGPTIRLTKDFFAEIEFPYAKIEAEIKSHLGDKLSKGQGAGTIPPST